MSYTHTKLSVAVDVLIFTIEDDKLKIRPARGIGEGR